MINKIDKNESSKKLLSKLSTLKDDCPYYQKDNQISNIMKSLEYVNLHFDYLQEVSKNLFLESESKYNSRRLKLTERIQALATEGKIVEKYFDLKKIPNNDKDMILLNLIKIHKDKLIKFGYQTEYYSIIKLIDSNLIDLAQEIVNYCNLGNSFNLVLKDLNTLDYI